MRERAHKKGEVYQRDVKHWLSQCTFLGLKAEIFGDAYDVTKKACTIGGEVFDFSFRLGRGALARHILYAECKYRNEERGPVSTEFKAFLRRAFAALVNADRDDAESALFIFVSNVPPDDWRKLFLADRSAYLEVVVADNLFASAAQLRARLAQVAYVLVLDARILGRS